MKTTTPVRWFVLLSLGGSLFAATPEPLKDTKLATPTPLGTRFKQVRDRIDSLFQHRIETPPPYDPRLNPFRVPGVAPANMTPDISVGTGETPPPPATDNLTLLQQAAATLKVSGLFEIGPRSHLVINARPYKEGDVVQTIVNGETVYVRVREISKRTVTLVLHDAEMTLKF